MNENGNSVKALSVSQLKPFPTEEVQKFIDSVEDCIVVEMNKTAQFKNELMKHIETKRRPQDVSIHSQLRYDGNPFRPSQIINKTKEVKNNE